MRPAAAFLLALATTIPGQAFGFEVDGYRSGMSFDEVQRRSGQLSRLGSNESSYSAMTPSGPVGPSFTFCDDRLYLYGITLEGGVPTLIRVVEQENARLGRGVYRLRNDEGHASQLIFLWQDKDATITITMTETVNPHNLGVTQTWDAKETVCHPERP